MSNLETYREKALKCARAADEAHRSSERVGLLGFAIVYMALADYVDGRHEHRPRNPMSKTKICVSSEGACREQEDQRQLENLRRGVADAAEQVAKSQEAIEGSLALLQGSDRMPVAEF